jgi:hypothetical protein
MIDHEIEIMTAILIRLDVLGTDLRDGKWWTQGFYRNDPRSRGLTYEIVHYGIPYRPRDWLDAAPTALDRQHFCRALTRLCALKLIVRVERFGNRTTHLQITPKGLTVGLRVLEKIGETVDLDAIKAALEIVAWATPEHHAALAAVRPQEAPAT